MPSHSLSSVFSYRQNSFADVPTEQNNDHFLALLKIDRLFFSKEQKPNLLAELSTIIRRHWDLFAVGIYKEVEPLRYQLIAFNTESEGLYQFPSEITRYNPSSLIDHDELANSLFKSKLASKNGSFDNEFSVVGIHNKQKNEGFIVFISKDEELPPMELFAKEHLQHLIAWKFEQDNVHNIKIQQQKKIEELNQHSVEKELFLNEILQNAPCGIIQTQNRTIQSVNQRFTDSTGFSADELKNKPFIEICVDRYEGSEKIISLYKDIDKSGVASFNLMFRAKNAHPSSFQITGIKVPGSSDKKEYLLLCQDKTDLRSVEKSLMESEEQNRKILEANVDGVFIINRTGELIYANQSGCIMTGYTKSELIHLNLEVLFPYTKGINEYFRIITSIQKEHNYYGEAQLRHKNGAFKFVEIRGTTISLSGKEHYHFSIHDITHRKKSESKLKESEEKFRSLSENLPDCILRIDKDGLITYYNSTTANIFGAENIALGLYYHTLSFEDKNRVIETFNNVLNNNNIEKIEVEHQTPDETILALDWSFSPELDEAGQCYSVLAIGRDISKRKEAEKELIEAKERAEAADRVKSIFLANLSHEIRTPLNAIVGFSNLLDNPEFDEQQRKEFIELINRNADNLVWMINEIIEYAKLESGHIQTKNLNINLLEVINNISSLYEAKTKIKFGNNVSFKTKITTPQAEEINVYGDPRRIEQILSNLLENSLKFVTEGFIELGLSIEDKRVRVYVKDTGIGISKENHSLIFEAFRQEEESTTKTYGGTGLGLAICKLLVEAMDGELKVISEKNRGAEFYFYLNRIS